MAAAFKYEELTVDERVSVIETRLNELTSHSPALRGLETQRVQLEVEIASGARPDSDLAALDERIAAARKQRDDSAQHMQDLVDKVKGERKGKA